MAWTNSTPSPEARSLSPLGSWLPSGFPDMLTLQEPRISFEDVLTALRPTSY